MRNFWNKMKNLRVWFVIGAAFRRAGAFLAAIGQGIGKGAKAFGRGLSRHRRAVALCTLALLVAIGVFLALFLTLPVKTVEIEGELILLEGERYVGGLNLKATTKAGLVHREEVLPSMLSGLDPSLPGEQEVIVSYGKWRVPAKIKVLPLSDVTLCVREGTLPTEFEPNDPFPSAAIFDLYYEGELFRSSPIMRSNAPEFTTLLSGEYDIALNYCPGLSLPYVYRVLEVIESITPMGKLYAMQGAELSKQTAVGNVRFLVKYKDGREREIVIYDDDVGIVGGVLEEREEEYSTQIAMTYKGFVLNCPVYAYQGSLLSVKSMSLHLTKTIYAVGETFDYTTAHLEVEYAKFAGEPVLLRVTPEMLPSVTFDEVAEEIVLTASYSGASAQALVRVISAEESVQVTALRTTWQGRNDGPPQKGQELQFDGATLMVVYGYGYREEARALTAQMVSGYDQTTPGNQVVTITCEGFEQSLTLRVGDPDSDAATAIFSIIDWSAFTYRSSDALVIPQGAYLDVEVGYGVSRKRVPISDPGVTITGFTPHSLEEQTLVISYEGLTISLEHFFVIDDGVKEMAYLYVPTEQSIEAGSDIDPDEIVCLIGYNNGDEEEVRLSTLLEDGATIAGDYDPNVPGNYPVQVIYGAFASDLVWIHVAGDLPVTVSGIRLDVENAKREYSLGESLDISGMKLFITYSNGSETDITEELNLSLFSGFSTAQAVADASATVTYLSDEGNYITSFNYSVK